MNTFYSTVNLVSGISHFKHIQYIIFFRYINEILINIFNL